MGYAATLSVVGSEVGVAGNVVSTVGIAWELSVDLLNANWDDSGIKIGFLIGGELLKAGLKKVLPGAGKKIAEKGFDLGTEILTQSSSLKASGIEKVTDAVLEKKNKEKRNQE